MPKDAKQNNPIKFYHSLNVVIAGIIEMTESVLQDTPASDSQNRGKLLGILDSLEKIRRETENAIQKTETGPDSK